MAKIPVRLSIRSIQSYDDQEPDTIELITEGTLERQDKAWEIVYEETELTGMPGVTTVFRAGPGGIVLKRLGRLRSTMIFREGSRHESLYQMEFGAMMLGVTAEKVRHDLTEQGGTADVVYSLDIEHTSGGHVEYHLEVKALN